MGITVGENGSNKEIAEDAPAKLRTDADKAALMCNIHFRLLELLTSCNIDEEDNEHAAAADELGLSADEFDHLTGQQMIGGVLEVGDDGNDRKAPKGTMADQEKDIYRSRPEKY